MGRVSFTLRSTLPDLGSYLRYDETLGAREDFDSFLRADGLQIAPATSLLADGQSSFSAVSSCYGQVDLEWDIAFLPRAEGASVGSLPEVTGVVVVYSPDGEPQTIAAGDILAETGTFFSYTHKGVPQGSWAYYSLFAHYESSTGDDYYEKAAQLSVLVPKDYGSTLQLWRRIPEYYRIQDSNMGTTTYPECIGQVDNSGRVGPLFKYLSIIGFDMDRMRTMLDYTMTSRDPDISHTEVLDAIAEQMGVPLRSTDLGAARLRNVLRYVGDYRRQKGTAAALEFFGQAITGGDVEVDTDSGDITIYSQRVNFVTDPRLAAGLVTHRPALDSEVYAPLDFTSTAASAGAANYTVSGTSFIRDDDPLLDDDGNPLLGDDNEPLFEGGGEGIGCVLIRLACPIRVVDGERVCFSVHSNVGTNAIKWARTWLDGDVVGAKLTDGYGNPLTDVDGNILFVDDNENLPAGASVNPTLADGARAFEIYIDNSLASSPLLAEDGTALLDEDGVPLLHEGKKDISGIEFLVDLREAETFVLERILVEKNRLSHYFDGDTVRGGWLIDNASSVSDYRWEGDRNDSRSLYADDYVRTSRVVDALLLDEVVPINEVGSFQIVQYNAVNG